MQNREKEIGPAEFSIAICIGTYNQAQFLQTSIESALAQTHPIQGIWISDDASSDNTDSIMREICGEHPEIHYFRQPVNLGLSGNLTWLLSQPQTDLIVRLDSDDRLEPEYAAILANLMQEYPEAGYAHCDVNEIDIHGQRQRVRRLMRTRAFESSEDALKSMASGYRVAANCILYRANAIREVDYYRPNLSWKYCEDWDMIVRLAAAGWGNVYAPKMLSNYRVWDDGKGVRASRKMAEVRETAMVYRTQLIPEYTRRGWGTKGLRKHMRARAVGFADSLDSPLFNAEDRMVLRRLLVELGDCFRLKVAIWMMELGLGPAVRRWAGMRLRIRDRAKLILHLLHVR